MSQTEKPEKILIIRFSSFGDVVQSLSIPSALCETFPRAEIHWVTRQDFSALLERHPNIDRIWSYNKKSGLRGLFTLARELRKQNFSRVYDAHNNLRSRFLGMCLWSPLLLRRSMKRWKRFLLFRFRKNYFEMPFSGQRDLLEPLTQWGVTKALPPAPQIFLAASDQALAKDLIRGFENAICLAPSAAYLLKRWPVEHWKSLILSLPQEKFILLGGPEDKFIADIVLVAPERCLNLAGRSSLGVSSAVIELSKLLIANDTGLLHVGEQLGKPCIALMGPAPFGFPSRPSTRILELDLVCRPCSKHGQGPCVNPKYHRCLVDISPAQVREAALRKIMTA